MNYILKKIVVILPVLVITILFLRAHYDEEYRHVSVKRLAAFGLTILLFYTWIIATVVRQRQESFFQIIVQSSFYVYIFMVLTLTGYFILFKEISSHGWWHKTILRIDNRDRVNLVPFEIFKIYKPFQRQVVGNLIMLFPLGIYLPLLYKNISGFFAVAGISLMVSICIELLQLATSYRSADIDDVILNTLGACLGFFIYKMIFYSQKSPGNSLRHVQS